MNKSIRNFINNITKGKAAKEIKPPLPPKNDKDEDRKDMVARLSYEKLRDYEVDIDNFISQEKDFIFTFNDKTPLLSEVDKESIQVRDLSFLHPEDTLGIRDGIKDIIYRTPEDDLFIHVEVVMDTTFNRWDELPQFEITLNIKEASSNSVKNIMAKHGDADTLVDIFKYKVY